MSMPHSQTVAEHIKWMLDEDWVIEAILAGLNIDYQMSVKEFREQSSKNLMEALKCLEAAEQALRLGNFDAAVKAIFIWSQRGDRILDGEESWADQKFDPTEKFIPVTHNGQG